MERALVVGAGVVGLSCAVRLLEAGLRVDVLARDLPLETTSALAAAFWYPYRAHPVDRVTAWSATTYEELVRLVDEADAGVVMRAGTELMHEVTGDPPWTDIVSSFARVPAPSGYADAWTFVAPVIEMPFYLRWLAGRVVALGGTITRAGLGGLPEADDVLVVNATGLGARLTAADPSVTPVRGQVVLVEQCGLERWWLDESGPSYVVPRSRDIVLGGTDDEGEWDRAPDPAVTRRIVEKAATLVPEIADARVLAVRVGLRPERPEVRLERERRGAATVVHCYGHGGAGVTLSWGCADEVVELARTS
ncbi:MAG: FAD-dependent oxidoreductase [Nocardioidaceae bacterium]